MVDSSQIRDGLHPAHTITTRIITTMLQRLPPVGRRTRKITTASQQVFRPGWYNNNNGNGQWRGGIITIDVIITITGTITGKKSIRIRRIIAGRSREDRRGGRNARIRIIIAGPTVGVAGRRD